MDDGVAAYSSDLGAGWGGEAFGKQLSAMTIEGNWIGGAMTADFPDVDYTVAELPQGPGRAGHPRVHQLLGHRGGQRRQGGRRRPRRVPDQRGPAAGVRRRVRRDPVGRVGGRRSTSRTTPTTPPFVAGADYAQNPPSQQGAADVIADFNAQLEGLKNGDPAAILASVQDDAAGGRSRRTRQQ